MSKAPKPKNTDQVAADDSASAETEVVDAEQPIAKLIIDCPSELGPVARQEWDRISGDLSLTGAIKTFDRAALAIYCEAYAVWIEAVEQINKYGSVIKSPAGYP